MGSKTRGLGPSNDEGDVVQTEIMAAEIYAGLGFGFDVECKHGYYDREDDSLVAGPNDGSVDFMAGWLVHAIDNCYAEQSVTEQTRHDVAASVARHAALEPDAPDPLPPIDVETDSTDGIDQSEPAQADEATLRDVDDEPTHAGAVDDRFDDGGEP